MSIRRSERVALPVVVLVLALCLAGCADRAATAAGTTGALQVVAAFYPLQFLVERVGGDHVSVTNLTAPGAEPHDLELSARAVAAVSDADLVVHLAGFQPAVDDAVAAEAADRAFDVGPYARLDLAYTSPAGGRTVDPHFWLDPTRLWAVAAALAPRLADLDPPGAARYRANARVLRRELARLDRTMRAGLASCRNRDLVTNHAAFGYFAARYGLRQVSLAGPSPDAEPDPRTLADISTYVERHAVRTVYSETLSSPVLTDALAAETGTRSAVLDPIEGLTHAEGGDDYLSVMRTNLATLERGQPCP